MVEDVDEKRMWKGAGELSKKNKVKRDKLVKKKEDTIKRKRMTKRKGIIQRLGHKIDVTDERRMQLDKDVA